MLQARILAMFLSIAALAACGGGQRASSGLGGSTAATTTLPAANAAAPVPSTPADEAVIDVCALMPRGAIEAALGTPLEIKNLNRTDPSKPPVTSPGYGGCTFEGPRLSGGARIEVGTAANAARDGLGSPRHFVETLWAAGETGRVDTVEGLGTAARLTTSGDRSFVIAAASDDRFVQVMVDGVTREQAIEITRAALTMPLR